MIPLGGQSTAQFAETWGLSLAKNRNKRWTLEEDERLQMLRSAGEPLEAIALTLKRTAVAVDRRFYTLRNREQTRDRGQLGNQRSLPVI